MRAAAQLSLRSCCPCDDAATVAADSESGVDSRGCSDDDDDDDVNS